MKRTERRKRQRGQAIVEAALMMPWLAFLFVGVLDFGFYAYSAICVQNAARAVAIASANPSSLVSPCQAALGELTGLPNMINVTTTSCTSDPAAVGGAKLYSACVITLTNTATTGGATAANCRAANGQICADCTLDTTAQSTQATVSYQTVPMIPIPGILAGQFTLTRYAEVRQLVP
jgi:hypothetical protein